MYGRPPLDFLRGGAAVHRLQKDPITLRLAILGEVEETQNAHNQARSYRLTHEAVNKDIHPIISPHPRYKPEEGGSTQQMFIRGGSAPRSNSLSFCIPFFTKTVPLSGTFYWQMVPLSHTLFRTEHPFCLKTDIFFYALAHRQQVFSENGHRKRIMSRTTRMWGFFHFCVRDVGVVQ